MSGEAEKFEKVLRLAASSLAALESRDPKASEASTCLRIAREMLDAKKVQLCDGDDPRLNVRRVRPATKDAQPTAANPWPGIDPPPKDDPMWADIVEHWAEFRWSVRPIFIEVPCCVCTKPIEAGSRCWYSIPDKMAHMDCKPKGAA